MSKNTYDVLIILDPRFMGGTAMAAANDMQALSAAGLDIGVHFVQGRNFFQSHEKPNPILLALLDSPRIREIDKSETASAPVAFFHHPEPFQQGVENPVSLNTERNFIVTHQAPFKGDGALNYDPLTIQNRIAGQFGVQPVWAPISGICRNQLSSFAPLLRISRIDWPNIFDMEEWQPQREKLQSADLTIGRHGRPHPTKWGESPSDIAASLPSDPQTHVRVMGADRAFFSTLGLSTEGWDILAFNAEPVPTFLDSLDVFSYFFASSWTETFGRTVAEAMLMGARCVLPPSLRATFGETAIYCRPDEVVDCLTRIRDDLKSHREAANIAANQMRITYSSENIVARLSEFRSDPGHRMRQRRAAVAPLTTARKWTGFHRRRLGGARS